MRKKKGNIKDTNLTYDWGVFQDFSPNTAEQMVKTYKSVLYGTDENGNQTALTLGKDLEILDGQLRIVGELGVLIDDDNISTGTTYSSNKITELVNSIIGFSVVIVEELPEIGDEHTVYLVPESGGTTGDGFDEYLYVNGNWEIIGTTRIDLSNYYTKGEVDEIVSGITDSVDDLLAKLLELTGRVNDTNLNLNELSGSVISTNDNLSELSGSVESAENALDELRRLVSEHTSDEDVHVTSDLKTLWNLIAGEVNASADTWNNAIKTVEVNGNVLSASSQQEVNIQIAGITGTSSESNSGSTGDIIVSYENGVLNISTTATEDRPLTYEEIQSVLDKNNK